MVGTQWDISWHRSIGRDTFWTPAHICIHICGVLAGISSAYLILTTTLRPDSPLRKCSVRIWGFRGPLGAFIAAWGGIAMITSAPFDNWWHNAYGLDVKILSPPHMVLAAGIFAVHVGALLLILGQMNRADGLLRQRLQMLFLYVGGMILVCLMTVQMELVFRSVMHTGHFYYVVTLVVPLVLAAVGRASGHRWGATGAAAVYTIFLILLNWILPRFPAEPKLGPVYYPVTQFTPPEWPLMVIAPAIALDLLWRRAATWNAWLRGIVSGVVFLGAFIAVQWPFADFLMSGAARNWFFGTKYFGYYVAPGSLYARYRFVPAEPAGVFAQQILYALLVATLMSLLGLWWGAWMRRVRR